jgi:hypothetical protein
VSRRSGQTLALTRGDDGHDIIHGPPPRRSANSAGSYLAAKHLADKREIHDTPQPGRWLTSAESALRVLARQGLARRRPNLATLQAAVRAWPEQRKRTATPLDWRFTTQDARIKLKRLYPSSQE